MKTSYKVLARYSNGTAKVAVTRSNSAGEITVVEIRKI